MRSAETISFSRTADMPFVERMLVRHTRSHFSAYHDTYTLCLNLGAGAEWLYRGQRRCGDGRMVMLMEPGETHRTLKLLAETGSFQVLHLSAPWVQETAEEAGMALPHFNAAMLTHEGAYSALLAFHRSMDGGASMLERQTRLMALLDALYRHGVERGAPCLGPSTAAGLRRAREYLTENFDQKVLLDDLAQASGLSKFHLVRAFSRTFGMTPHVFLNQVRVSRARARLRLGECPAAADFGFFDQSHFIQVFRQVTGVTPGQYASACVR